MNNIGEIITLRRITRRNYRKITNLRVKPEQRYLIASNAVSMADAYFYKDAWYILRRDTCRISYAW
ncbi:MAG: hypothetical protein KGD65_06075 [Candidatus Lokiarchaeota archaeon]|nr:hypothetical protein [Candidatus Lokiarchaeota archaeon]